MMSELYIYKKEIDWSALHLGINIPVKLQDVFYDSMRLVLKRGEKKGIKLLINGEAYIANLANISFDERKYPNHKDLLQIRYTPNSMIAKLLRSIFSSSYDYLLDRKLLENKRKPLSVPIGQREYVAIYATPKNDELYIECITNSEIAEAKQELLKFPETELELLMSKEDSPAIIEKSGVSKIRKLDRTIGDALKVAYNFKCQICALNIGDIYSVKVAHTHHIEYFSISLNNNADNIMVICPNHHSIIHATNPIFDRKDKVFLFPNGYIEKLQLNLHL